MSRHDVLKRHDFRSAMKSKEKLSSMKSVRFDGIYNGKEAEVGHGGGGCPYIYIYVCGKDLYALFGQGPTYIYIHIHVEKNGLAFRFPGLKCLTFIEQVLVYLTFLSYAHLHQTLGTSNPCQ